MCCLAASLLALGPAFAQTKFTAAEYSRAEKFMGYNTTPLVLRSGVRPTWLADERFWYRVTTAAGSEFVLVDPAKGTRGPAFDHAKMAAALSSASGRSYTAGQLPFQEIEYSADGQAISFQAGGRWQCDVQGVKCTAQEGGA
ncbi:MAG: peptidase dipeptidylpeptidase domain protein, partial [Candidatus Solibacter sp.]|nr:peptidase dipeptidylpeptidase domain protein [Candidatus Solibacter sp.]